MMNQETINQKLNDLQKKTELLNLANHKVLSEHVIVVPVTIQEQGITKKAIQYEDRPEIGLVVNVSEEVEDIEEGDVVFFGKYSTTQVTHNAVQYQIVRVDDIYCVAKP